MKKPNYLINILTKYIPLLSAVFILMSNVQMLEYPKIPNRPSIKELYNSIGNVEVSGGMSNYGQNQFKNITDKMNVLRGKKYKNDK